MPRNRDVAEGALGGGESIIQQAGLTIAVCGSYVNLWYLILLMEPVEVARTIWGRPVS